MGKDDIAKLLERTLAEEEKTDQTLTQLAADRVNKRDRAFPNAAHATCHFDYRPEGLLFELCFLAEPNEVVEVMNTLGGNQKQQTGVA